MHMKLGHADVLISNIQEIRRILKDHDDPKLAAVLDNLMQEAKKLGVKLEADSSAPLTPFGEPEF